MEPRVIFLSSVLFLSLILVSIVWGNLNPFLGISFTKLRDQSHNKLELQTILPSSNEARSVISTTSTGSSPNHFKSPTVLSRVEKDRTGDKVEEGLARVRAAIRRAALNRNVSYAVEEDDHDMSTVDIYRNPGAFYQSYMEMEKSLRVFVYEEGEPPFVHDGPCKDLYTVEGRFIQEMEFGNHLFRTSDPHRAHVYFMPYSVTMMVSYLYKPYTYDVTPLQQFVSGYLEVISNKYPFWNRTLGADHFMLACHDWGPDASRGHPYLYNTSIRVLCNANISEGFNPRKDVSLPEIYLYDGNISPELLSVPPEDAPRPYIAFFSGGVHGPIRPLLLKHWKERDNDLRVFEYLPKNLNYYKCMLQSKFCLCPSGYEVASPRIVEAIYAECVPVILSENYVLPFSDVLRWEAFSVQVDVSDIPNLKKILSEIPEEEYKRLKKGIRAVKKHFVLNKPVKRYDAFHMILHSIWLRRLNVRLDRQ